MPLSGGGLYFVFVPGEDSSEFRGSLIGVPPTCSALQLVPVFSYSFKTSGSSSNCDLRVNKSSSGSFVAVSSCVEIWEKYDDIFSRGCGLKYQ